MLTAIKNAKKKKREEQSPDDQSPDEQTSESADTDDVVRSSSKALAKPVSSNRSLHINDDPSSGQNQATLPKPDKSRPK
ncbi:hypothetical protein MSG28_001687 [Choristoneura fumiferana]|uniref:Uncharacterized protein n=1 Tax=Choristoneura fumiferana TaxID=7141 RepID=A0ACC0KVL3_CHOFU|nr:hypothetical protein MSG28_001687 [Choristoneura fumiferana]